MVESRYIRNMTTKRYRDMTTSEKTAAKKSLSRTMKKALIYLARQGRKDDLLTGEITRSTLRALRDRGFIEFRNVRMITVNRYGFFGRECLRATFNVAATW